MGYWKGGAVAAALMLPSPVAAQVPNFSGTWAFQTDAYSTGSRLSGVAVATMLPTGQYSIRVTSQYQNGQGARSLAYQNCRGVVAGTVLTIACQVTQASTSTYAPDDFIISPQTATLWSGTFSSQTTARVWFARTR